MRKKLVLASCCLILLSCNDSSFCDCLQAGDKLDKQSTKILNGDNSREAYELQEELHAEKKEVCKDFELMDGAKLKQLRDECQTN